MSELVTTAENERESSLVAMLRERVAYPWQVGSVEVIETHISWLFLAGACVVKVKRPVQFGFVDHTTLERRHHACQEEVRLNRRLTTNVYLDVVPIVQKGNGVSVAGDGEPIEWATLMRRLPAYRMLDQLLMRGEIPEDLAERLADVLIPFHRSIADGCDGTPEDIRDRSFDVLRANLDELRAFAGERLPALPIELIEQAIRPAIERSEEDFLHRLHDGYVREGHGDLRCEHVCLDGEETQIFDCVEFNSEIRCADIASDLAFLLMDLERLGHPGIASQLVDRYRNAGIDLPDELLSLYKAHRALVRAKISAISHQGAALQYLGQGLRTVYALEPVVVIMTGLSGTGKSTLARMIGQVMVAPVFSSDVVRKELAGVTGSASGEWKTGIYGSSWSQRTYHRLFDHAEETITNHRSVVLDAAFLDDEHRTMASETANRLGVRLMIVETLCDPAKVAQRLEERQREQSNASDADLAIFNRQRDAIEHNPPVVPTDAIHLRVDTNVDRVHWLDPVIQELLAAGLLRMRTLPA